MRQTDDLVLTSDQLSRNLGVDPDVVREALRMRKELEHMGIWVEKGSRIRSPYSVQPHGIAQEMATPSLIFQR